MTHVTDEMVSAAQTIIELIEALRPLNLPEYGDPTLLPDDEIVLLSTKIGNIRRARALLERLGAKEKE